MTENACPDWLEEVSAYLDGQLAADAEHRMHAHLRTCPGCAAYLVELVPVVQTLRELPDLPPPRDLWPDLARELGTSPPYMSTARTPDWGPRIRLAAIAVAALLVAVLVAWLARQAYVGAGSLPVADEAVYWGQHQRYAQDTALPTLYGPEVAGFQADNR